MKEYTKKKKCDLGSREDQEAFWEAFLGRKIGKPYKGAVEKSSNALGKFLPEGTELTMEEINEYCNG